MAKKIYIAGPMSGYPLYNFPAFDAARDHLLGLDYTVYSPADHDRDRGHDPTQHPEGYDWSKFPESLDKNQTILLDVELVINCDCIYMLDGWEKSKGALAEKAVAEWARLEVLYQTEPA